MKQLSESYAKVVQYIYRLVLLQLYWILFVLLGGVIFGIFPATRSLIEVMQNRDKTTAKEIFQLYWQKYRLNWILLNKAGAAWMMMFLLMGSNLILFMDHPLMLLIVAAVFIYITLSVIYFLLLFERDMPIVKQIYRSFAYGCIFPKNNIIIMASLFVLYLGIHFLPGVVFFFGISVCVYLYLKMNLQLS